MLRRIGLIVGPWTHKKVVDPLLQILRRGLEPKQLAFSVALGVTLGLFPIVGVAVFLCGFAIAALGSMCHAPTVLLANFIVTPIELRFSCVLLVFLSWYLFASKSACQKSYGDKMCRSLFLGLGGGAIIFLLMMFTSRCTINFCSQKCEPVMTSSAGYIGGFPSGPSTKGMSFSFSYKVDMSRGLFNLVIPFLRLGESVSGGPHFALTSDALTKVLTGKASWEVILSIYHALLGWLVATPFILAGLYVLLLPCFTILVRKFSSGGGVPSSPRRGVPSSPKRAVPTSPKMIVQPLTEVRVKVRDV